MCPHWIRYHTTFQYRKMVGLLRFGRILTDLTGIARFGSDLFGQLLDQVRRILPETTQNKEQRLWTSSMTIETEVSMYSWLALIGHERD